LILLPFFTFLYLIRLLPNYAPIDEHDVRAMRDQGREATGRTLIVSPHPNIDGWWFEGLTGRPALIGDHLRWYVLDGQRRRSIDARALAHASSFLDGGSLKIMNAPPSRVLWVMDNVEFYPLLRFTGKIQLEGSPNGFRLDTTEGLEIEPSPGAMLREISGDGATFTLRCEYKYELFRPKGFSRTVTLEVLSDPWDASVADGKLRIESTRQVSIEARVEGLRPSDWRWVPQNEILSKHNISHVLVRGNEVERFRRDPRFDNLWTRGSMTAFRVMGL
jgi:hypothetical protein